MPDNKRENMANRELSQPAQIEKTKFSRKVLNFLFSDRLDSIGTFLMDTYIKPGLCNLGYNLGVGTLAMIFRQNGTNIPQNGSGTFIPGVGYQPAMREPINYNAMSNQIANQQQYSFKYYAQGADLRNITFATRDDAYTVLDRMNVVLRQYGKVTVAGFYESAGITPPVENWALSGNGWHTLEGTKPIQTTTGRWILDLPPVQALR